MQYLSFPFIILVATVSISEPANILGLFPINVKSHYILFERVLKRLAEKGHNVDVVTQFPSQEVPSGFNQISLTGSFPILSNNLSLKLMKNFSYYNSVFLITGVAGVDVCKTTLNTQILQNLKRTTKKYDLIITEVFGNDCMLGFGHIFDVPTVGIITSTPLPWANDRIGNLDNPSYIPNYLVGFSDKMNLFERFENTVILILSKIWYTILSLQESNRLSKEFFGPSLPSLEELAPKTSLILGNTHPSSFQARPAVPNFIEIGGVHIEEPKPLSLYFENLVFSNTNGIIYLSMGSLTQTETFDEEKLQGMFDAFAALPYKVLWKAKKGKFPKGLKVPNNIHFEEWMPQIDILCHPNVKLFFGHGGLLGLYEALYCGVPTVAIPCVADQYHNTASFEKNGLTLKVAYQDIRKETILEAAEKLLKDPSYKQNVQKVSRQFFDRPFSPLDTTVYWVEYVIRHKGAPHLRTMGADLPWYHYYLVDVFTITIVSFLLLLSVLYFRN